MSLNADASRKTRVQVVQPWSTRGEDRLVFSLIAAILLVAALLLQWLYPAQSRIDNRVPQSLRHDLTALGNAAEEILMLREVEGGMPSLAQLVEMGIAPFAGNGLDSAPKVEWRQFEGCIIGKTYDSESAYQMRLAWRDADQSVPYRLSWRRLESGTSQPIVCAGEHEPGWRILENRIDTGHTIHDH